MAISGERKSSLRAIRKVEQERAKRGTVDVSIDIPGNETPMVARALVAYSDLAAGRRAIRMLDRLTNRFEAGTELCLRPWSFALLEYTEGRALAKADFKNADIIIVSISRERTLPASVENLMRQCLSNKPRKNVAIVALLGITGETDVEGSSMVEQLRRLTSDAGQDFFALSLHSGLSSLDRTFPNLSAGGNQHTQEEDRQDFHPPLASSANRINAVQHWGINE